MVLSGLAPPGWHGKLPTLGDFASRRLDQDFIERWDGCLASAMLKLREGLGDDWLDAYLASPSWRFLLLPGVLGGESAGQAWAGVLMPSVDRVGRYFPFTIVQPLNECSMNEKGMPSLWTWLAGLDDLAAAAMHDDWSVDRLEEELARVTPLGPVVMAEGAQRLPVPAGQWADAELSNGAGPAAWIGAEAHALWRSQVGATAYWHSSAVDGAPRLLLSRDLPLASMICGLLGGPMP